MWTVQRVEAQRTTLDFTSSGQARREVTQIFADSVLFANASQLSSWDESRVQVIVCQSCGIERCEPGGWLAPHSAGDDILFVPVFSEMLEHHPAEYAPPGYVNERGIPLFSRTFYSALRNHCASLPEAEALPPLRGADLLRCLQWEAPLQALGTFPAKVELRKDLLLAVSDGDVSDVTASLRAIIERVDVTDVISLRPAPANWMYPTLYLDGPGTREWRVLARDEEGDLHVCPAEGRIAAYGCFSS